jgi:hypothetical protein
MKPVSLLIAAAALACSCVTASAQQAVKPQWKYKARLCLNGYDFYAQKRLCRARGGYGGGPRYGAGYEGRRIWGRHSARVEPRRLCRVS